MKSIKTIKNNISKDLYGSKFENLNLNQLKDLAHKFNINYTQL
jgi:sialic acid synthase SpsE